MLHAVGLDVSLRFTLKINLWSSVGSAAASVSFFRSYSFSHQSFLHTLLPVSLIALRISTNETVKEWRREWGIGEGRKKRQRRPSKKRLAPPPPLLPAVRQPASHPCSQLSAAGIRCVCVLQLPTQHTHTHKHTTFPLPFWVVFAAVSASHLDGPLAGWLHNPSPSSSHIPGLHQQQMLLHSSDLK